jgi:hypothetical protein
MRSTTLSNCPDAKAVTACNALYYKPAGNEVNKKIRIYADFTIING